MLDAVYGGMFRIYSVMHVAIKLLGDINDDRYLECRASSRRKDRVVESASCVNSFVLSYYTHRHN
jgi:hypothetical protein